MAALLVEAAEAWMHSLESGERGKRPRDVAEPALRHRAQIHNVTILRDREEQGIRRPQDVGEAVLLHELAHTLELEIHGRGLVHRSKDMGTRISCTRTYRGRVPICAAHGGA
jgi:hypothetical protein